MRSFSECMQEYRKQLEQGAIQEAYKGLMAYMMDLRTYFKNRYPDCFVSGSLYYGYMDMTYFAFVPEALKRRNLKVAIVFNHEAFGFEVWLGGYNKQVQKKYWQLFKENEWNQYRLVPTPEGVDSIVEGSLADNPDFGDLEGLTRQIESRTLAFVRDIEAFLAGH